MITIPLPLATFAAMVLVLALVQWWAARRARVEFEFKASVARESAEWWRRMADEQATLLFTANQAIADAEAESAAIDEALAAIYGVPLDELVYATRLDAIKDLRRKGRAPLRYFDAPAAMRELAVPAGTESDGSIPTSLAVALPYGIADAPVVQLERLDEQLTDHAPTVPLDDTDSPAAALTLPTSTESPAP